MTVNEIGIILLGAVLIGGHIIILVALIMDKLKSDKSPSPCRHTLEDGADTTTELVSGKSSGFIGGMQ